MRLGQIDNLILFGGGQRLANFILCAHRAGFSEIVVFSGKRHLQENLRDHRMSLEDYFKKHKIKYFEAENIALSEVDLYLNQNSLGVSFGAPWIFTMPLIKKFKGRLINAHGMNLPRNRGGGGFSWQIMSGDKNGSCLFHLIDEGIDSGDIVCSYNFLFPRSCRIPEDYQKFFEETEIKFLKGFLKKIKINYNFKIAKQDEYKSSYFPRLSTAFHGFVNWDWEAQDIERFICAFDRPYQGASTFVNGNRVFLKGVKKFVKSKDFHPFMSGLIYRKTNKLFVAVRGGSLLIDEVYKENGSNIALTLKVGYRFITPSKYLEEALSFRAVYDAKGLRC